MLFEDKLRRRPGPMLPGEAEYDYYDSSSRPAMADYRALINAWVARMPEVERPQAIARFRDPTAGSYQAMLAELVVHEALLRQGYAVELHPQGGHPRRRPDFLVTTTQGQTVSVVEVTSINPTPAWVARSNREAAIYNAIDSVELPRGYRLGYAVECQGTVSPNLNALKAQVCAWAAESAADSDALPTRMFSAADWQIELTLYGGFETSEPADRAIATAMGSIRQVTPELKIRQAVEVKGRRYGPLRAPYLIVVADNKDELTGGEHNSNALLDAMFGSIVTRFQRQANGTMDCRDERSANGYWGVNGGARNRNVSGVLLLPKPNLWHLRDERWQPLILHNPWAEYPLPEGFFPLPGFEIREGSEILRREGQLLADCLGLPTIWPLAE